MDDWHAALFRIESAFVKDEVELRLFVEVEDRLCRQDCFIARPLLFVPYLAGIRHKWGFL